MKTIAVIGPDQRAAQTVASQLARCRAIVGAGPQDNPDGVVAVVSAWTEADQKVVDAVSQAMGAVVLYRPRAVAEQQDRWQEQPGVYHCTSVGDVQEAVDTLFLNQRRWEADARRADLERADRVRVAVRLEMNKVASEMMGEGKHTDTHAAHSEYVQRLRLAVLRQGVACPSISHDSVTTPPQQKRNRLVELGALAAGMIGGLAMGFALGRVLGHPGWGLVLGLLLALVGAGVRVGVVRANERQGQAARQAAALKEAWSALTTDVLSRVQIPRVADAVGGR